MNHPSDAIPAAAPRDESPETMRAGRLKAEARRLGFDMVGIAPAVAPPGYPSFLEWLRRGHAAGMGYLERRAEARGHPDRVLDGVRSVVVAGFVYGRPEPPSGAPTCGRVAR